MLDRVRIARIEIQPADGCTLTCVGCQHYSPQRGNATHDGSAYREQLARLWTFCEWEHVFVGGGEPFLHPDLAGFLAAAHDGPWGHRFPHVITNGFWLIRRDWRTFATAAIVRVGTLVVSRYPVYVGRLGVAEWDRRLGVLRQDFPGLNVTSFHAGDPAALTFAQNGFHHEPRPILDPHPCMARFCFQLLPSGWVAKCPMGRALGVIPNATSEFEASYRGHSLYDLSRGGEGFAAFVATDSHPACALCGIATGGMWFIPWANDPAARTATGDDYGRLIGATDPTP